MKLMALVMMVLGLMASGSAKAAETQVCGQVIEVSTSEDVVIVSLKTATGTARLPLDNRFYGTGSSQNMSANTNIVNLATAAMNNPGSLNFCAKVNDKNRFVSASVVNKHAK
ncbi:MAG: hypothetical protein V4760_11230 [Bdellovibrionota bacterium]